MMSTGNETFKKVIVCTLLLLFAPGCTTTRSLTLSSPQVLIDSVRLDDVVEIRKVDGSSLKFDVTGVSREGIGGAGEFVPYHEIQTISVLRESPVRTGLLVVLGIGVLYAIEKNADCGIFNWDDECDE